MSTTPIYESGFIITNATTPAYAYMNQLTNTVSVVNLKFTPTSANPTVPLKVTVQMGGQVFTWDPVLGPNETYELNGIVVPYLSILRAYGNSYTVTATGYNQPQANVPSNAIAYMMANAFTEDHPFRPNVEQRILVTPKNFCAILDEFVNVTPGLNPAPKTASIQLVGSYNDKPINEAIFGPRQITKLMVNRKIVIPSDCEVYAKLTGNVTVFYQWAMQRVSPTRGY